MPKVDILLAVYNGEKYLKEQIESILNQTEQDFRLIISDDRSTDNSFEIMKEYSEKDNRIICVRQEKNGGYVKNFEALSEMAESKYFAFSDQDDVWLPDKIEKSLKTLQKENAVCVISDVRPVNSDLSVITDSLWKTSGLYKRAHAYDDFRMEYMENCAVGCTLLGQTDILRKILPFPKDTWVIHDYYTALCMSFEGRIAVIDEPLLLYRQHQNNQIGINPKQKLSFDEARKRFIDRKYSQFSLYCDMKAQFPPEMRTKNEDFKNYLDYTRNIKYISFKNLKAFFAAHEFETFSYTLKNLITLASPGIGRVAYKILRRNG